MGLDMYLNRKTYVQRWDHIKPEDQFEVSIKRGDKPYPHVDSKKISWIIEQVGYWRKANAIHRWFVENVQSGKDDCKEHDVSREQLKELLKITKHVLEHSIIKKGIINNGYSFKKNKETEKMERINNVVPGEYISNPEIAQEFLPLQGGFFFGSTDYDQWYVEDLKNTVKILEEVLKDDHGYITYKSSW